jgi:hypothetical protein
MKPDKVIEYYERLRMGQVTKFPTGMWTDQYALENARILTKYMIEDILRWNEWHIKMKLTQAVFQEHRLGIMLVKVYSGSVFDCINDIYPGKFREWELVSTRRKYWNLQTARSAFREFFEEIVRWNEQQIKEYLTARTFVQSKLAVPFYRFYKGSPFLLLTDLYPEVDWSCFKPRSSKQSTTRKLIEAVKRQL